jgi:hypothetical protein
MDRKDVLHEIQELNDCDRDTAKESLLSVIMVEKLELETQTYLVDSFEQEMIKGRVGMYYAKRKIDINQ